MGRITLIYQNDGSSGQSEARNNYEKDLLTGKIVEVSRPSPDDYLQILKAKKSNERLEAYPNLPKSLTPKGYTQFQIILKLQQQAYELQLQRLRQSKQMFEDPEFPADNSSIGDLKKFSGRKFEWKRIKEINPKAQFIVGGATRFDIIQGTLGDCWLLAVIASISEHKEMFQFIVPQPQDIQSPDYVGLLRVRFWRYGQWKEVMVDDRLPVLAGTNTLAFMRSNDNTEFWSAIVEKAYAKLYGCYTNLDGGTQAEAMEDVTGGICETIDLTPGERPADLLEQLKMFAQRCCLMGAAISSEVMEEKRAGGLIAGHAYSVTAVRSVAYRGQTVWLLRVRNPWGDKHEWTGAWSDNSSEWRDVTPTEKKSLEVEFKGDGEFWMSYDDFVKNFTTLEVCHLGHESLDAEVKIRGKGRFEEVFFAGSWERNVSAGGCINNRDTFHMNPQFRVTVTDPDPDDNDKLCTIIIGLMQHGDRRRKGEGYLTIGFMLYEVKDTDTGVLGRAFFAKNRFKYKSSFVNSREVVARFRVVPATYIIIPSTFEKNEESKFILRVFTQKPVKELELDNKIELGNLVEDIKEAVELENVLLNEDKSFIQDFCSMADDGKGGINAMKLQKLLNGSSLSAVTGFHGFSVETCRSVVASVDTNLTGLIEIKEIWTLWNRMKYWKHLFMKHDIDGSGYFCTSEFREALHDAGYVVSNRLFDALVHRYTDPESDKITFEDFMLCVVRLQSAFDTTSAHPKNVEGASLFTKEDYMRFATYI